MDEANRVSCPFLGMDYDRNTHYPHIEDLHRCYRDDKPAQVAPSVQAVYCIGPNYEACKRHKSPGLVLDSSHRLLPTRNVLLSVAIVIISFLAGRVFFNQGRIRRWRGYFRRKDTAKSVTGWSEQDPRSECDYRSWRSTATATAVKATATPLRVRSYAVVRGDTLYSIAARNGTTTDAIVRANDLPNTDIYVGQILKLP